MTRLAIVTYSVSHFEVPLYRLMNCITGLHVRVFHLVPMSGSEPDPTYGCKVDWGFDLNSGFDHRWVSSFNDLLVEVGRYVPDVVLVYGYSWPGALRFIFHCRRRGIPLIHRGTLNTYYDPRWPVRSRLRPFVQRPLLRLFNAHHYGGSYSKDVLRRCGIDEDCIFFVPYSVDTDYFRRKGDAEETLQRAVDLRRRLGWERTDVLLFAAQHSWFKGPDIALRVFAAVQRRNPQVRLLICGSGAMTKELVAQAESALEKGSYYFTGFVPSAELPVYYRASDLFLVTSRYETWGRAINEAMLCQLPCVTNRVVPAAGDLVIDHITGMLVGTPEVRAYTTAVLRYMGFPGSTRDRMRMAAREHASRFAYENFVDEVIASIDRALRRR